MKLRVLLVDDNLLILESLRKILEAAPDIEVVGVVANGAKVLEAVGKARPDVVCMDINMPGLSGIEATRQLLAVHPKMKVIGLSVHTSMASVVVMLNAGAMGFVTKSDTGSELLQAIRMVSQSQTYLSVGLRLHGAAELGRFAIRATPA